MRQEQFEKLFSQHSRIVYRAAYSVTGNEHDAQDIVQDLFLKLIDRGLTLESVANPAGYLFRMAINEGLRRFRIRKRKNQTDDGLDHLEETLTDDRQLEVNMRRKLLDAMAQLDPEHAEVLVLWADHGYTDEEIAGMLGKSRGAVAMTLNRAKARLRKIMSGEKEREES
jgi:RNA polymerase sigma-70 factor (ECF subfamily)